MTKIAEIIEWTLGFLETEHGSLKDICAASCPPDPYTAIWKAMERAPKHRHQASRECAIFSALYHYTFLNGIIDPPKINTAGGDYLYQIYKAGKLEKPK